MHASAAAGFDLQPSALRVMQMADSVPLSALRPAGLRAPDSVLLFHGPGGMVNAAAFNALFAVGETDAVFALLSQSQIEATVALTVAALNRTADQLQVHGDSVAVVVWTLGTAAVIGAFDTRRSHLGADALDAAVTTVRGQGADAFVLGVTPLELMRMAPPALRQVLKG
jgi:hypothetical protein